jgi:hypothetical protein
LKTLAVQEKGEPYCGGPHEQQNDAGHEPPDIHMSHIAMMP